MDGWLQEWVEERGRDLYVLGSMSKLREWGLEMGYIVSGCLGRLDLNEAQFKGRNLE